MMKILNVYGSSIDGSSATIANRFLEKAAQLDAEIQSFKSSPIYKPPHNTNVK